MPNTINAETWLENSQQAAAIRAARDEAVAAADTITGIGANVRKANFDATRAPLPTDDETQGYAVGSRWMWQGREWIAAAVGAGSAAWVPRGTVTPEMFGANGGSGDTSAFQAVEALGAGPVRVSGTYNILAQPGTNVPYELDQGASVTVAGGPWYPRLKHTKGTTPVFDKINPAGSDPSPDITGTEYPIVGDSQVWRGTLRNWWGKQPADITANPSNAGRTGIDLWFGNVLQYGEGDAYVIRANGIASRHSRNAQIETVKGQNNIGLFNGEAQAATDQVTLYGAGDIVLKDNGHDNVAQRGVVVIHYVNGSDTYGYPVDRFSYMAMSLGANSVDGAYIVQGKYRVALDTTLANLSSDAALAAKEGQRVYFGASGASRDSGYAATDLGDYWIRKSTTASALQIGAAGARFDLFANWAEVRPSTEGALSFRVFGASETDFAAVGQSGTTAYLGARTSGTGNTTLALQTALAGNNRNVVTINANGQLNLIEPTATLQIAGTKVVGARQAAIANAASGTEVSTVNAILAALRTHGLIAT